MRVEYTFDEAKIKANGYSRKKIYNVLEREYGKGGFICSRADDVLVFDSPDLETDLETIFIVRRRLANSDWFLETATSFLFYEDEFDTEPEDFLVNIRRLRRKP